ncbi:unnamed protein product [Ilex paraguariensis]|uniref:Uncharacterized protein n=1 Tax=Ilex paraguariensis TaxID=185542 RepID=A0ABC8T9A2_9AQUA
MVFDLTTEQWEPNTVLRKLSSSPLFRSLFPLFHLLTKTSSTKAKSTKLTKFSVISIYKGASGKLHFLALGLQWHLHFLTTMAAASSLLWPRDLGIQSFHLYNNQPKSGIEKSQLHSFSITLSSRSSRQGACCLHLLNSLRGPVSPVSARCNSLICRSFLKPGGGNEVPVLKAAAAAVLTRFSCLHPRM